MTISDELTRLQNAKSALKTSIENKGVTVSDSTLLSGYSALVDQIQTGGGGGNEDLIDLIERDFTTFNIPSGTTKIADYAFGFYTGLKSITIPNSVTSIGEYAFRNSGLTGITIPDSVKSIGGTAFGYCKGITNVTIGNGVTSIGEYAFSQCTSLTSVTIGNSVTNIGRQTFYGCTVLTNVTIPNSVTTIDANAFNNCSGLTSITIGNGVTSIGSYAFGGCIKLTSVTINATTPPTLGSNVFGNTNNCPIYVPAASVSAYKAATNWSSLASRIQAIPS